jgi:hypothetical protein
MRASVLHRRMRCGTLRRIVLTDAENRHCIDFPMRCRCYRQVLAEPPSELTLSLNLIDSEGESLLRAKSPCLTPTPSSTLTREFQSRSIPIPNIAWIPPRWTRLVDSSIGVGLNPLSSVPCSGLIKSQPTTTRAVIDWHQKKPSYSESQ